jgi:predicted O-methyltransferase YrrM
MEEFEQFLHMSESIPGWTRGKEALEVARTSLSLAPGAVIIEIGVFFGSGTVLLAGPRKIRGSGSVHAVDPFDCSGDPYSTPVYREMLANAGDGTLRDYFDENIRQAGLTDWVEVHQGRAAEIAMHWATPVDMIFLDGDQSRRGSREAYESWSPFLRAGGIIAIHNSSPTNFRPDHDGHRCLVEQEIHSPQYTDVFLVDSTTLARKIR